MLSLMFDTDPAPTPCESCLWTTCPGCEDVPVYDNGDRCGCGSAELTYGDGYQFCHDCETRAAVCTCTVVGDEDVQCGRCREFERDEMVGGAL
jgi:hypothetical protein